jgi:hypothetical protein
LTQVHAAGTTAIVNNAANAALFMEDVSREP